MSTSTAEPHIQRVADGPSRGRPVIAFGSTPETSGPWLTQHAHVRFTRTASRATLLSFFSVLFGGAVCTWALSRLEGYTLHTYTL